MTTEQLDVEAARARFPALARRHGDRSAAYLDGPGGTQVPQDVIDATGRAWRKGVSNLGGGFAASLAAEEITDEARLAMADFFNATPAEIVFGQNMTSLTFAFSRALAAGWGPGDAVVLTSLDHDANFTPWALAARDRGVEVRVAEFDPVQGTLDPAAIEALLDQRVRMVAVCAAANSLGTVVDVAAITRLAHAAGALVYVDAVHMGPHRLIDMAQIDCDFLVASAYKFFGPHTGILFGKLEHLAAVDAYRVRPAPADPPGKWETGTQSFESLAGVTAAVDYLASLAPDPGSRRGRLERAMDLVGAHEGRLIDRFLAGVRELGRVRVYGPTEAHLDRVATFAVGVDGLTAPEVAAQLIDAGLYVWAGHYYALNVMERLGTLDAGGLVRIGFVHYNTAEEVDRVLEVLAGL
jgi:cysteine desulfurase family protein (TIGR01976 family)